MTGFARRLFPAALLMLPIAGWQPAVRGESVQEFWAAARNAIGTPQALEAVQGLHAIYRVRGTGRHSGLTVQFWLAPPSRFLTRAQRFSYGFDGHRLIGVNPPWMPANAPADRYSFLHWSEALLLYDPQALGVTIRDDGPGQLGKTPVRMLRATAGDSDFDMVMYFDPKSHRLLRTDGISMSTLLDGWNEPIVAFELPEHDTYGEYKKVNGVELPLTITREIVDGMGTVEILDVVNYQVNPKALDQVFQP